MWALYSSHDPLVVVIQESDGRFGELLRSPREAQGLSFSHQINGPTVSQRLGRGDGKDQGTLPQLFTHYVMCSENMYKSRTCKNRQAARGGSTLPALAKPPVSSNTEVSSPPTVAVWPPTHRPVSGSGPQPLKGQEQGRVRKEMILFLHVRLLNKNSFMTIQYLLAISVEKIISLYIQKYRFEHYENNQGKYREKIGPSKEIKGEN